MPERSLRFGVANGSHRAATWKLWTQTQVGKSDFYLAHRGLKGALKTSFHESGRWHVSYPSAVFEEIVSGVTDASDRFIQRWQAPNELSPGCSLAYRILTPSWAVNIEDQSLEDGVSWIPAAPAQQATEVDIFVTGPTAVVSNWPGKRSKGTQLIDSLTLDNGAKVCAVYWFTEILKFPAEVTGRGSFFRGNSEADLAGGGVRALCFGSEPDGSRTIWDCAVGRAEYFRQARDAEQADHPELSDQE